jgi:hypothetical protein
MCLNSQTLFVINSAAVLLKITKTNLIVFLTLYFKLCTELYNVHLKLVCVCVVQF